MKHRASAVHPPLQIVTGKGGVGKSTVAAALALGAAERGHRVLGIEIGEPAGLAAALGVNPRVHAVPVEAAPGLSIAFYDGEAALAEYLGRFMLMAGVIQSVFSHPLYRAFVSAGPGVRELMTIGKVRDELLGLSSGGPLWDLIVVDAGASGHALQLLGMPAATARTFRSGLAHRESGRVARLLADPSYTAVHVVALPEEMPLEEAAESIEKLRELELPIGRVIVNRCRRSAPPGTTEVVAGLDGTLRAVSRRALGWLSLQETGITALERRVSMSLWRLPRLLAEPMTRGDLATLARHLAERGADA